MEYDMQKFKKRLQFNESTTRNASVIARERCDHHKATYLEGRADAIQATLNLLETLQCKESSEARQ